MQIRAEEQDDEDRMGISLMGRKEGTHTGNTQKETREENGKISGKRRGRNPEGKKEAQRRKRGKARPEALLGLGRLGVGSNVPLGVLTMAGWLLAGLAC